MKRAVAFHWLVVAVMLLSCRMLTATDVAYDVRIVGIRDPDIRKALLSTSVLVSLKDKPPFTLLALRRRASGDVADLLQVMHSFAYYDARIDTSFDKDDGLMIVTLEITRGPQYYLKDVKVLRHPTTEPPLSFLADINLSNLNLEQGGPALATDIVQARDCLLLSISKQGYPFAEIVEEEVLVDTLNKCVSLVYHVDTGPKARFGPVNIVGLKRVRESFVKQKICWRRGALFDPRQIEATENALQETQLFDYVSIKHSATITEEGALPITIEVAEGKHRSVGVGLGYTTQQGPGISGEWEHRNIAGLGRTFSIDTDLWNRLQKGTLMYRIPNFFFRNQELIWLAEFRQEETTGYEETSASLSGIVEIKCSDRTTFSYGESIKHLHSTKSDNSGDFTLLKVPLQYRYNSTNNLLNPTKGGTLSIKFTPIWQIFGDDLDYVENMTTVTLYRSLDQGHYYVVASKAVFGSIFGAGRRSIPPPERFYSGNENTLRGYNYLTVSPLNAKNEPIGGRSMLVTSLELRVRHGERFGWVTFYEIGNVYKESTPQLYRKQLQSVGFGLRYYTPVGPFRLDVAFPLNRRPSLDDAFQFYFSIGQAF